MTPEWLKKLWEDAGPDPDIYCWLNDIGFFRKHIIRDPSCLFRATSDVVYSTQRRYKTVRKQCVTCIAEFGKDILGLTFEQSVKEYVEMMSKENAYGGFNEISVMNKFYRRDFIIIDSNQGPIFTYCKDYGKPIYLFYQANIKHFDILLPLNFIKISALCQSIVYKIIYEGVFMQTDVELITNKMLSEGAFGGTNSSLLNKLEMKMKGHEYKKKFNRIPKISSGERGFDKFFGPKNMFANVPPFPYKVARGISSRVYKNLEFDIWVEIKREEEMARNYNDGRTLQVGVKCLCKLDPNQITPYICYIQAMKPDELCEVYIEELGEKKLVNFNQLEPLPLTEAKPWYSSNKKGNAKLRRNYNTKHKKSMVAIQDCSKMSQNKNSYRTRIIESKTSGDYSGKDPNNNSANNDNESLSTSTCSAEEWESLEHVDSSIQCLQKYTRLDYYLFKPCPVEYVTMPFTVEQNGSASGNRDSANHNNRQSGPFTFPLPVTSSANGSPLVPYPNGNNTEANAATPPFVSTSSSPPTSSTLIYGNSGTVCPGSSPYSTVPVYCMPSMPIPPVRPTGPVSVPFSPRLSTLYPVGVNLSAQRSLILNGSDLPYNDVPTLRFFYNLGIEWVQSNGCIWPPMSMPPPTHAPTGGYSHVYYQQPTTPNQLALDMQQNLNLDDSPSNVTTHDSYRNYNNENNQGKGNGSKFGDYRKNRGGSQRYNRNDNSNYKNNTNFQRGPASFNNNNKCNKRSGNHEKKEDRHDADQSPLGSPSITPNATPIMSYPPPPFYRVPYYPDGDVPINYGPAYGPYLSNPDDMANPAYMDPGYVPPGYVPYIPPPTMMYPQANMTTYYPPNYPNPNPENPTK